MNSPLIVSNYPSNVPKPTDLSQELQNQANLDYFGGSKEEMTTNSFQSAPMPDGDVPHPISINSKPIKKKGRPRKNDPERMQRILS